MKEDAFRSIEELQLENNKLKNTVKEQQERLNDILSSVNEVIWSRRVEDFSLCYINDACENIFGYTAEELLKDGGIFFDHIHPDDKQALDEQIKNMIYNGYGALEYRIFHKDGSIKYIYSQSTIKRDAEGNPVIFNGTSIDVTRLHEFENDLRKKVKDIESIFESITDSFIALDKNFNFTYINKEAERLYKCKRDDLIGKNIWDMFPKGLELKFYPSLTRALKEQVSVHFEEYSPSIDTWLSANVYPTPDGLAVYFKDISERKKLQDKILNNEKSLRAIINNTKDIIWSMDTNMNIISANQAYYDRVALLTANKPYDELTTNDFEKERVEKWTGYFSKALSGKTFKVVEEDTVDGDTVFEEISFNPIYDKDNIIVGVSCFSRDVSAERILHDKILKNEQNLLATINNTNDSIWSVDKDLKVILINQASKDFVYKMTGIIAEPGHYALWKGFPEVFLTERKKHYERALAGEVFKVINDLNWDENKPCYETSFCPIRDAKGNVVGVSCVARDISEHLKQIKKIQEQNNKLTEIAWIQSHKVRGPVANILGLTHILNIQDPTDPSNKEVLETIQLAAQNLDNVIHEVVGKAKDAD